VIRGIPKCPHAKPARSKNGFGIEAKIRIVINPYFFKLLMMNYFIYYEVYSIPYCFDN
jgi:hypothetical protein